MKKINMMVIFILLSISLSESYIPNIESSRALSFISSYGNNGSESFGIISKNLKYNLSPKIELWGNINLQIPMGVSNNYNQGHNNFNGALNIGGKYNLSNNTSITFQCVYSTNNISPYNSLNHSNFIIR